MQECMKIFYRPTVCDLEKINELGLEYRWVCTVTVILFVITHYLKGMP